MTSDDKTKVPPRPPMGWCSRREGDDYAPDEHDGSNLHAQTENCANWTRGD